MNCHHPSRNRAGFTLVELLVGILIIGILAGILSFALIPALNRAKEYTIQQEMTQLTGALENFKTKYGFYPPSFVTIDGASAADAAMFLLPYFNRIAPNHELGDGSAGTPFFIWWNTVGQEIHHDDGDDLVFWLGGLCKNQQNPLYGISRLPIPAFPIDTYLDGAPFEDAAMNPVQIERQLFYEFNESQILSESVPVTGIELGVAHYVQPSGPEASFLYIDAGSYGVDAGGYDGYTNGPVVDGLYENPDSYQLLTYGLDGLPGNPGPWQGAGVPGEDNICNFSDGRLDRMILGIVETTNKN